MRRSGFRDSPSLRRVASQGEFTVTDSRFVDADPATMVFDLDDDAVGAVVGGCGERHPDATYQTVEPTASLTVTDVGDGC